MQSVQVSLPGPRERLREVAESGGGGIENRQSLCTRGHKQGSDREEQEGAEVSVGPALGMESWLWALQAACWQSLWHRGPSS